MSIGTRRLMRAEQGLEAPLPTTWDTFPTRTTHPNAAWTRNGHWLDSPGRRSLPIFDIADGFVLGSTEPTWANSGCRIPLASLTTNTTTNFITTADGQEITGLYLPNGRIEVRHKNVYIHDCYISIGYDNSRLHIQCNGSVVTNPNYDTSGLVIAHVTTDPVNAGVNGTADDADVGGMFLYGGATGGRGSVVFRCAFKGVTDCVMPDVRTGYTEPVHVWGNYLENRWLPYDPQQPDGTHNDGVQITGGDGMTIVGNAHNNPTGGVIDPGSGFTLRGQCIVFTPYHQPQISGVYVYKNWLYGSYTQISLWTAWDYKCTSADISFGGPAMAGVRIIGNRHGGQCVWPILVTPAQNSALTQINGNVAANGDLVWNNGTTMAGNAVTAHVAASPPGTQPTPTVLTAFAGPNQTVEPNVKHALIAKGYDPTAAHWIPRGSPTLLGDGVFTQISGTSVSLTRVQTTDGVVYTYTTPSSASSQTLVFRLTITAENAATTTDDVTITVSPTQ